MCSHEKLQESHIMLQVESEVVNTSLKRSKPPTQSCTHTQKSIVSSCANACCSQGQQSNVEQVPIEPCDDLLATENDQLKIKVKRLEVWCLS